MLCYVTKTPVSSRLRCATGFVHLHSTLVRCARIRRW